MTEPKTPLFEERMNPSGWVRIYKQFVDGSTEEVFEGENLIVTSGRSIMLDQLHYTLGGGDPLTQAKVGTGGAIDPEGLFLKAPTADMTNLYSPAVTVPIIRTNQDPMVPSITLMASVDNAVGNGLLLNEAGFFSVTGRMFNIKTFPRVAKTSSFSLNIVWRIRV